MIKVLNLQNNQVLFMNVEEVRIKILYNQQNLQEKGKIKKINAMYSILKKKKRNIDTKFKKKSNSNESKRENMQLCWRRKDHNKLKINIIYLDGYWIKYVRELRQPFN